MSFVGGLFTNYDATAQNSGAEGWPASPRQMNFRSHNDAESPTTEQPVGLHRAKSSFSASRKGSVQPTGVHQDEGDGDETGSTKRDEKTTGDSSSDEEDRRREQQVLALARRLTETSTTYSETGLNPFDASDDSKLNPHSKNFNVKAWAKAMLNFHLRDPDAHPLRTAGIAFRDLNVFGYGVATDYQKDVFNVMLEGWGFLQQLVRGSKRRIDILRDFEGIVNAGEMLVVFGPPGSGCSTFLKTVAGETHGINIDAGSYLNYQGISADQMHKDFRGEALYTAEIDVHFPMLTVGDTLSFAARARLPRHVPGGLKRMDFAQHIRDVVMAVFGISHTVNTRVGNEYVRGASGGERKRVSIAEATLSGAPLQCWDNSTRGLDSANAIEFCRTLRTQTEVNGNSACVAIYQAPQAAYDTFDKVILLYEGRQIFFGPTTEARAYFERLGFECPARQTTADFLTSMTSPQERIVREGWENKAPRTPDDFARCWKDSAERQQLRAKLDEYDARFSIGGEYLEKFQESRRAQQAKHQRPSSPYTISYSQQVSLCLWRGFRRLVSDPGLTLTALFGNFFLALIFGSVFYNLGPNTASFYSRAALLFFSVLLNAFSSALEILTLYAQRPIVEKHQRYAFYHPSAEAVASMLTDMPYKISNAIIFNLTLYFMTNLRREPGAFFFYLLISFMTTLMMSMMFRTIASVSRTLAQALAPAGILMLAIIIFAGFAIPTRYMLGWSRWINYIDPVSYSFESLMINEFHERSYSCSSFVPTGGNYSNVSPTQHVCSAVGAQPGSAVVLGDAYINSAYQYYHAHKWRNLGILISFMIFFAITYLVSAETVQAQKSKGEVLVFQRGHMSEALKKRQQSKDEEASNGNPATVEKHVPTSQDISQVIQRQTAVFHWEDVCYDIKIKGNPRRILDRVDGWVKPGTLTALMGVSGAGKTTLLDALATRITKGVVSGEMLVDGKLRDKSFQRKTGYVQQQDLHLSTSTVREALCFSALLRQPAHIPRREKIAYVSEVIKLLDMEEYADAVVGVLGEGLNVEQRKRLTIGVELAAKPDLLLFLDEPTSGLDSQTSWAILDLLEKLKDNGQAILCTIHQPSAMLFQRFNRLLFLKSGGQTVYFGEVGKNSQQLTGYFERNGAPPCPEHANPAEWMLEITGAAPGSHTDIDWFDVWRTSPEYTEVKNELRRLKEERPASVGTTRLEKASYREFAAPFAIQLYEVQKRVFQQYWRTPSYIYSKLALCLFTALFIGFVFFKSPLTQQGLQNQMLAVFMLITVFGQLVQQIMPNFVTQRALYEVRERPAKTYSWQAFMMSNIIVELPYQTAMAVVMFFCWYYPIGMYRNAIPSDQVHERGALMFLFILAFLIFTSTFSHMIIAAIENAETGGNLATMLFSLCLIFCGVLATPAALPGFWIFMYRVSPLTYLVSGILATGLANTDVTCASNEYLTFDPQPGKTCGEYLEQYMSLAGGYLQDANARSNCSFCTVRSTNAFLKSINTSYDDAWRNFGLMWVYIAFNIAFALFMYWLVRVPDKFGKSKTQETGQKSV